MGYNVAPTAEVPNVVGTASEHVRPLKMSKPRGLGLERRVRARQGLIFYYSALCALVSMQAIVAAVEAGSCATGRGKHGDSLVCPLLPGAGKGSQSEH